MRDDGVFPLGSVETRFQRYEPAPYPQSRSREFVPYLSVVDALFEVGPSETLKVIRSGARAFKRWETEALSPHDANQPV